MRPELETAYANRFLRSPQEVKQFDDALGAYARSSATADMADLLSIFDDRTENQEVMFGLVHLIEDLPAEPSFRVLIDRLPAVAQHAAGWADTMISRILNDDKTRPAFAEILRSAPKESRDIAVGILRKAAANPRPRLQKLRDGAGAVLSAIGESKA